MMKRVVSISVLLLTVLSINVQGQFYDPVEWSYKINELGNGEAELIFSAEIEDGWHMYSQDIEEGGPIRTSITFKESANYKLIGKPVEKGKLEEIYDPNFEMDLQYYGHHVEFVQKIKILSQKDFKVYGELEFAVCDDEMCLPPDYAEHEFKIKGFAGAKTNSTEEPTGQVDEDDLPDETLEIDYTTARPDSTDEEIEEEDYAAVESGSDNSSVKKQDKDGDEISMWIVFGKGFAGGLLALFMPCIFPMIPLTVSFFTKQSKTKSDGVRKAIIYGVSIIGIYLLLGLAVTFAFGSDALNALSTNPWFNLVFFALFVVFAFSFFGAFEITLPSSWVNKADSASNKGGLMGIFFMAFTLALVSFSCTGPIIGTLLVDAAQDGDLLGPAVGMFGFSLALALPFVLFAAFPAWLNSMPKSGGWLNMVKVSLGFLELAFALKFLSNADLVWQAGLLKRELFIAIWVGIFGLLSIYLMGGFKMPHDSPTEKVSIPRLSFAMIFLFFTIYLIPGMFGAPVKLVSAFVPPDFYAESPIEVQTTLDEATGLNPKDFGAHPETCPLGLNCFHDYEDGLKYAKKVNKPILLDFTGWACVNCRKMEANVWSDADVFKRINEDFVLISLYVDEREKLPEEEQYVSEVTGKKIRTVGNKWSEFEAIHFKTNAQPHYVIVDYNLNPMLEPTAYDPDIPFYINWLDKGKKEFYKRQGK